MQKERTIHADGFGFPTASSETSETAKMLHDDKSGRVLALPYLSYQGKNDLQSSPNSECTPQSIHSCIWPLDLLLKSIIFVGRKQILLETKLVFSDSL